METLIDDGSCRVLYFPNAFEDISFSALEQVICWQQNEIKMFGKVHPEPRFTQWFGLPYSYSSIQWPEQAFPPAVLQLKERVEALTRHSYNGLLCNLYRDGTDHMGWHRDNEKEVDQSSIASLSFGAERTFFLRNRNTGEKVAIQLRSGSLLLMENAQEEWEHSIPKRKRVKESRINLTFRKINSGDEI